MGDYKVEVIIECRKFTADNVMDVINWLHKRFKAKVAIGYNFNQKRHQVFTDADGLTFYERALSDKSYFVHLNEYIVLYLLNDRVIDIKILEDYQETTMYYTGATKDIAKVLEQKLWVKLNDCNISNKD